MESSRGEPRCSWQSPSQRSSPRQTHCGRTETPADHAQRGCDGLFDGLRSDTPAVAAISATGPLVWTYGQRHGRISARLRRRRRFLDPLKLSGYTRSIQGWVLGSSDAVTKPAKLGPTLLQNVCTTRQSMTGLRDLTTCTCACTDPQDAQSARVANLRRRDRTCESDDLIATMRGGQPAIADEAAETATIGQALGVKAT